MKASYSANMGLALYKWFAQSTPVEVCYLVSLCRLILYLAAGIFI